MTEHDITEQESTSDERRDQTDHKDVVEGNVKGKVEQAGKEEKEQEAQAAEAVTDDPVALRQELDQARAQASEYLDGWQRARAELANAKKRMERELAEERISANARLILRLLPVVDDFDRAVSNLPPDLKDNDWVEGILLIQRKLHQILESEGVKEIAAVGQPFDPTYHEAIGQVEDTDYPEGTVADVAQKGYLLGERVLRPAFVRVAK